MFRKKVYYLLFFNIIKRTRTNVTEHITARSRTQSNERDLCSCSFAKLTERNFLFVFVR
ncbi:hypothetical protein Hanom_Chr10g00954301 [Helianthus anomalus]